MIQTGAFDNGINKLPRMCSSQELRDCKVESTKSQASLFEKDTLLQRKDVEVCTHARPSKLSGSAAFLIALTSCPAACRLKP